MLFVYLSHIFVPVNASFSFYQNLCIILMSATDTEIVINLILIEKKSIGDMHCLVCYQFRYCYTVFVGFTINLTEFLKHSAVKIQKMYFCAFTNYHKSNVCPTIHLFTLLFLS